VRLTQRVYEGIAASEQTLKREPIAKVSWEAREILPAVNPVFEPDKLRGMMENKKNVAANRIRPAMVLGWMQRVANRTPIVLGALHVNDQISTLHLPAECFVEYQLRAQQMQANRFVAVAAYGDGGAWYIPVKEEYPKGGYEVSVANGADSVDEILTQGMRELLGA
jgi:hypothetical protein